MCGAQLAQELCIAIDQAHQAVDGTFVRQVGREAEGQFFLGHDGIFWVSSFREQSSGFKFQGAGLRFQGCSALLHASGARKQVSRVSVQIFSMILSPDFERSDP